VTDEYLTPAELAARLKLRPKSVRNRMYDGTWRRGEHWFSRRGIGPRFRWAAIVTWLEAAEPSPPPDPGAAFGSDIPPARRGRRRATAQRDLSFYSTNDTRRLCDGDPDDPPSLGSVPP
jgi:hypothetical protein